MGLTEHKYEIEGVTDFEIKGDKLEVWGTDVGDGYHKMSGLYDHRHHLFLALLKVWDTYITPLDARGSYIRCWKAKVHEDGTMYPDHFIAGMTKTIPSFVAGADPEKFDISYHLPMKYWHMCTVTELITA